MLLSVAAVISLIVWLHCHELLLTTLSIILLQKHMLDCKEFVILVGVWGFGLQSNSVAIFPRVKCPDRAHGVNEPSSG